MGSGGSRFTLSLGHLPFFWFRRAQRHHFQLNLGGVAPILDKPIGLHELGLQKTLLTDDPVGFLEPSFCDK